MASVVKVDLINQAVTATTTGTGKALEAYSCDFVGWLHVSAINGATTVTAKLQHSSDGTNWVDLTSFTALVGVVGIEAKAITTPILTHVRAHVTLAGGVQTATVKISLHYDKRK